MEAFELRLWDGRLGRWLTVDPMGQYASPYLGMGNNPISRIDPDGGMDCDGCPKGKHTTGTTAIGNDGLTYVYDEKFNDGVGGWSSGPEISISAEKGMSGGQLMSYGFAAFTITAEVDGPAPAMDVGAAFGLGATALIASAISAKDYISPTTATYVEPQNTYYITLYRGVSGESTERLADASMGIARPYALGPIGHTSSSRHTRGDWKSAFTSWSISKRVADYHANKHVRGGLVLKKRFRLFEVIPGGDWMGHDEGEFLVPGVVEGAEVLNPEPGGSPYIVPRGLK